MFGDANTLSILRLSAAREEIPMVNTGAALEVLSGPPKQEATMGLMAQFAAGVERCRWKMARPGPNRMRLDVHLKLTPPISASLSAP